jgi:hypothetical protein
MSRREADAKSYNKGAPKFMPKKAINALKLDTIDKSI